MAESQQTTTADPQPVMEAPTRPAAFKVIATMVSARLGLMLALGTPLTAGLAIKLQDLLGQGNATITLGIITSVGAALAMVFDPIFGRISDSTTGRFGRRRPWLVIGSFGLLVGLAIIALAPNVLLVGVGWAVGQIMANAAVAAHTATIADQLPSVQRGKVSGAIGVVQQAAVLGAAYSAQLFSEQILLLFMIPGVVGVALVVLFAFVLPDQVLPKRPELEGGIKTVLMTFWVNPAKNPDFGLAWFSRFLLVLANFMFITFRLFWLQHEFGLDQAEAAAVMGTGVGAFTLALVIAGQLSGWISDKIGRRKVFIIGSALIFAVGMFLLTRADSYSDFYVAEVVLGVGFGIYVAVDLALVIDVLPNPDTAAKDLGVFNIAMAGPQSLAPLLSAFIIEWGTGQNYDAMLITAAVFAAVGALLIVPIRKVR